MEPVATFECNYCHLCQVLGEPKVSLWNGLTWTRWHVHHVGHCFAVSALSDEVLGHGRSCTCDEAVIWDVYSSTEERTALVRFIGYLTDGEFKSEDPDEAKESEPFV